VLPYIGNADSAEMHPPHCSPSVESPKSQVRPVACRLRKCDESDYGMQAVAIPGGNVFDTVTIVRFLPQPRTIVVLSVLLACFSNDCRVLAETATKGEIS
jgi:hypothetical protein